MKTVRLVRNPLLQSGEKSLALMCFIRRSRAQLMCAYDCFLFVCFCFFVYLNRRFSVQRCARCHLGISASEMVMRARDLVYHLNCFTCISCSKTLTTGDHFGMKDSLVYCQLHFETLKGEYQTRFDQAEVVVQPPHTLKGLGPTTALGLSYFNGVATVQKGRPRKRKSPGTGAELAAYNAGKCR